MRLLLLVIGAVLLFPGATTASGRSSSPGSSYPGFVEVPGIPPFSWVFVLHADTSLVRRWSEDDFAAFMTAVFDSNQANREDSFPVVWDYFCFADEDSAWDRIRYRAHGEERTRIDLVLFDPHGPVAPANPNAGPGRFASPAVIEDPVRSGRHWTFVHELAHVCDFANEAASGRRQSRWAMERSAEAAGYVYGINRGTSRYQTYFDAGFVTRRNGVHRRRLFRVFNAYLTANYSGAPGDPTDDLIYNWIRMRPFNLEFRGLGAALDSLRRVVPGYEDLGEGPDEMVGSLFHRFRLALYVNRSDLETGRYGFGSLDGPREIHFAAWVDTTVLRARSIPAEITVRGDQERPIRVTSVVDPVQSGGRCPGSATRKLEVPPWGADYLVFRADPGFVRDAGLRIRIEPDAPVPEGTRLRVGTIVYEASSAPLWEQPVVSIEEQVATIAGEGPGVADFTVSGFGGTGAAVVVVLSLVEDPVPETIREQVDGAVWCFEDPALRRLKPFSYGITYALAPGPGGD